MNPPPFVRFWSQVNLHGPVPSYRPDLGACWIWKGFVNKGGYGRFRISKKHYQAHRYAWAQIKGSYPKLDLDHLCRVRNCVNVHHLEEVTNKENLLRGFGVGAINARKLTCLRGHKFDALRKGKKERRCRTCNNEYKRISRSRLHPATPTQPGEPK